MPRFHFNIEDHVSLSDDEGTELRDAREARLEGVAFAGAYLRDNPGLLWDGREFRVRVTDRDKAPLFTIVVAAIDDTQA